ncbi:malate dehydrogenase (oxaloacetate-decarboxylating) [Synchytrium microbalum]|uniref:Malic enzyme n=1 Tax=Synchytrium microbalum TaxID=1806994 RepID=A0A507CDN8_9FUNG|nr:malate dehydrogenase (oxaloacetate-decarboxylating) [Synchytrium microbalum]TPX37732.1 malate dehydrogenase (oxaloacetate-decarboxylating) [Synchytrium microbalum]
MLTPSVVAPSESNNSFLTDTFTNQGTALTMAMRTANHLRGRIPTSAVETIQQQCQRCLHFMNTCCTTDLDKYNYLQRLKYEDITLFYRLVVDNLSLMAPLIYTPTIGEACVKFSTLYTPAHRDGLFLSMADLPYLDEIMMDVPYDMSLAVMTDGSRILGLGDLGLNGMGIPQGKLALYIAAAGFNPTKTLAISLDLGTNTESIRNDPFYLGARTARPNDAVFFDFVDKVMAAVYRRWPRILVQFEDFSTDHAFDTLARYRDKYLTFNDDIQGTGAVILSGFINAVKMSGVAMKDHRVLFFGAGSAGVGVATQLAEHVAEACGISIEQARGFFWMVDSKGLITADRGDKLQEHKVSWARKDNKGIQYKTLLEVLQYAKPTCLIGLATIGGAFDAEILVDMAQMNQRPIIMPLSNPLTNAECTFADAVKYTHGRCLFASGTAFPVCEHPTTKKILTPGQGNNMYIFPGLGLGSVIAGAKHVTDTMVNTAAVTLANSLTQDEISEGLLYPRLARIREISAEIARDVALCAVREGLARDANVISMVGSNPKDAAVSAKLLAHIKNLMYAPVYPKPAKI